MYCSSKSGMSTPASFVLDEDSNCRPSIRDSLNVLLNVPPMYLLLACTTQEVQSKILPFSGVDGVSLGLFPEQIWHPTHNQAASWFTFGHDKISASCNSTCFNKQDSSRLWPWELLVWSKEFFDYAKSFVHITLNISKQLNSEVENEGRKRFTYSRVESCRLWTLRECPLLLVGGREQRWACRKAPQTAWWICQCSHKHSELPAGRSLGRPKRRPMPSKQERGPDPDPLDSFQSCSNTHKWAW